VAQTRPFPRRCCSWGPRCGLACGFLPWGNHFQGALFPSEPSALSYLCPRCESRRQNERTAGAPPEVIVTLRKCGPTEGGDAAGSGDSRKRATRSRLKAACSGQEAVL